MRKTDPPLSDLYSMDFLGCDFFSLNWSRASLIASIRVAILFVLLFYSKQFVILG